MPNPNQVLVAEAACGEAETPENSPEWSGGEGEKGEGRCAQQSPLPLAARQGGVPAAPSERWVRLSVRPVEPQPEPQPHPHSP